MIAALDAAWLLSTLIGAFIGATIGTVAVLAFIYWSEHR